MFSNELVCKIIEYLNSNINKEITIDELSMLFFFDKTYIMKRFKKELGIPIHKYINTIRIYNSLPYFKYNNQIISIAFKNGFNSLEYFSEIFKNIVGVSPMIYKKYINYNPNTSKKDEDTILNNVAKINNIKNMADAYLMHRKPTIAPVKKLVFKPKNLS
ncbi:MAG: helix-turn-helix transcriptional regulator [Bacilli bacterium]|nr:helix-turn-helix transcriptional regulator [Bacilli bacterium]